jgi:TPR repeat protein
MTPPTGNPQNGDNFFFEALAYLRGVGKRRDYVKALDLLRTATELGHDSAASNLAVMYRRGLGCIQDNNLAAHYFGMAAEKGNAIAQFNLGNMYYHGWEGEPADYQKAFRWYSRAAERGHAASICNLACMFDDGRGVQRDAAMAARLFRTAAGEWLRSLINRA